MKKISWVNVYPDLLDMNDGNYVYMEYSNKFNAERTATKYRLYLIKIILK